MNNFFRGEVHFVKFNNAYPGSSVMEKTRPAIIVSNDKNNEFADTVKRDSSVYAD